MYYKTSDLGSHHHLYRIVNLNRCGVIILSFSALISLHFSGDLKQFGLGVDNYDMTLRDVSLLLFVGLLLVIFWILIGITFLSILIPILVIAALLTKRLLSSK